MRRTSVLLAWTILVAPTLAIAQTPPLANTISCEDFAKQPSGAWRAIPNAKPFDVGTSKAISVGNTDIGPRAVNIDGADLYGLIEQKCGKSK